MGTVKLEADGWYLSLVLEDKTVPVKADVVFVEDLKLKNLIRRNKPQLKGQRKIAIVTDISRGRGNLR